MFKGCFKSVSNIFQECFVGVQGTFWAFFKAVSGMCLKIAKVWSQSLKVVRGNFEDFHECARLYQ